MKKLLLSGALIALVACLAGCGRTLPGVESGAQGSAATTLEVTGSAPAGSEPSAAREPAVLEEADAGTSEEPQHVRVPIVRGRSESRAKERLRAAGFRVKVVRVRGAEEPGTVLEQKPASGRIAPGTTVTITVAAGGRGDQDSDAADSSGGEEDAAGRAFEERSSGVQLSGAGSVTRVLADDDDGSRHQRFILRLASGQTILVAHNIDIAQRIPSIRPGDSVAFNGVYEWSSEGGTVHWTHHDPAGRHEAGWLKHEGKVYQ